MLFHVCVCVWLQMMKEEMELVQEMENTDDRDAEMYLDKLETVLDVKSDAIAVLRAQVTHFQSYRRSAAPTLASGSHPGHGFH